MTKIRHLQLQNDLDPNQVLFYDNSRNPSHPKLIMSDLRVFMATSKYQNSTKWAIVNPVTFCLSYGLLSTSTS